MSEQELLQLRWVGVEAMGPKAAGSTSTSRLMLAVLEEALLEFQRGVGSARAEERQRFHEVDRWVDSADTDLPFAFESICSSLLIDPDYIRSGLRRLKQQAFSGQPTPVARRLRRGRIYHRRGWRGQIG